MEIGAVNDWIAISHRGMGEMFPVQRGFGPFTGWDAVTLREAALAHIHLIVELLYNILYILYYFARPK